MDARRQFFRLKDLRFSRCLLWLQLLQFMSHVLCSREQQECSFGCPSGYFQSTACSNSMDRICAKCSQCSGSSYEVRPCSPISDRQCLHVAHPLLIAGEATTPSFLEEMKVDASENIFLEDLHSTRNLETTYYVTDLTQASDFYWDRESGIRVNIGILNVHVIPKYEDIDHDSDNKYMANNPNNVEDKTKFRKVVTNHCRHPIPDYYSITLEISRDRATAAEEISCDSTKPSKPPCPPSLNDGDLYLHRTLNDACQRMGTFPEPLQQAGNSIVCTDNSDLLRDVFNQTFSVERPIRFPSKKCRTAMSRCEQCLNHPRCLAQDVFEKRCCQIDCYTLVDCKLTVSRECTDVPVECAMGDAFRYTLQPVFQNIRTEFQCHLRHQRHAVLYELFYFIQVPGTDFQTPKVFTTVYAKDLRYQSRGDYQADYLTVEHNTGLDLRDEFILVGHENRTGAAVDFAVHSLKPEDQYRRKRPAVHKISHNIFVASTQFERPFDYSTSSWVRDNDCGRKNVSKMKVVQKHYGSDYQIVNVATQQSADRFEYFLKSTENPPYLRFTVPGNMSILPYYFRNGGPHLLIKDALKASLELTTQGRIWEIQISGTMSSCPAYLGLTINNRLELEELFRYDLLILCPSEFNVTFKVPNWGQHPDKTFDVRLQDAVKSYDVYLTQLILESTNVETESGAMNVEGTSGLPLTMIAILAGALLVLIIMLTVAYVYKEFAKAKLLTHSEHLTGGGGGGGGGGGRADSPGSPNRRTRTGRQCIVLRRRRHHRTILGLYFVFWIVYSLTFTFTVLFAVLSMALEADLARLAQIDAFRRDLRNTTAAASVRIERHGADDLRRQSAAAAGMQRACSVYVGELLAGVARRVDDLMTAGRPDRVRGANASVSHLFVRRTERRLDEYSRAVDGYGDEYRRRVDAGVSAATAVYYRYLQAVLNSDWFSFAQLLFNASERTDLRRASAIPEQRSGPNVFESGFGSFLEIEEVEDVKLWPIQFWQRFFNRMPHFPEFPSQVLNPSALHCTPTTTTATTAPPPDNSSASRRHLDRLPSSRFYAVQTPPEEEATPTVVALTKFSSVYVAEEHRFYPGAPLPHPPPGDLLRHHHPFPVSDPPPLDFLFFFDDDDDVIVGIDALRVVFLVLDVFLLLHRFTNVYLNGAALSGCLAQSADDDDDDEALKSSPDPECRQNGGSGGGRRIISADFPERIRDDPTIREQQIDEFPVDRCRQDKCDHHHHHHHHHHHRLRLSCAATTATSPLHDRQEEEEDEEEEEGSGGDQDTCRIPPGQADQPPPTTTTTTTTLYPDVVCSTKMLMARVIGSPSVPKMLFLGLLCVVGAVVVRSSLSLLTPETLLSVDLFGVYLGAVDVQVNQTNWFLADEAKQLNDVALNFYRNQMNLELLNLQTLVEHFNAEQKRLVDNYVIEACALKKLTSQVNWTCDVSVVLPKLEIPMLPCNFMPIQSHLYTGSRLEDYETEVSAASKSFMTSARNVVTRTSLVAIVTVCVMLSVDIVASLLYHRFQAAFYRQQQQQQQRRQRRCCRHRHRHHHPSRPSGGDRLHPRAVVAAEAHPDVSARGDGGADYDSDDDDDDCPEVASAGLRGCSASGFCPADVRCDDVTNSNLAPVDFKYSETKV